MMRINLHYRALVFVHAFFLSQAAFAAAQDEQVINLAHLFSDDMDAWYEISYRCSELAPVYFARNEQDSLSYILQYWEEETGVIEPVRRLWMLNQIQRAEFTPDYLSSEIVDDMLDYMNTVKAQKNDSTDWRVAGSQAGDSLYYINGSFNRFTKELAIGVQRYADLSDDEYLLCLFYSHEFDEFWRLMNSTSSHHTALYKTMHNHQVEMEKLDVHFGGFAGYWSPRKSFALLGDKANIGGTAGIDWQRLVFDATLLFQFLDSENLYTVKYKDEFFDTKHYFRFYFGIEPAFKLYDWGHTRVHLLGGCGLDVAEAVSSADNPIVEEPISVVGLNLSLGIGAQHFLKRGQPWSLQYQLRYEFGGYDTGGGTDLSGGEALSFRLGLSWDMNARKHELRRYFR